MIPRLSAEHKIGELQIGRASPFWSSSRKRIQCALFPEISEGSKYWGARHRETGILRRGSRPIERDSEVQYESIRR
jgi:hypothetical protein